MDDVSLSPPSYTAKWQKSDRFDGELEEGFSEQGAVQGEVLRRPLVPVVEAYVDGHVRRAMDAAGDTKLKVRELPLTGAVMSRLPHYRLLPCEEGRCSCRICQKKSVEYDCSELAWISEMHAKVQLAGGRVFPGLCRFCGERQRGADHSGFLSESVDSLP